MSNFFKTILGSVVMAGLLSAPAMAINWDEGFDKGKLPANQITVDTTNFSHNLSSLDSNIQHALNTLDQLIAGSGTVTSVTASNGLTSSGGTTPNIAGVNAAADGSTKGVSAFTAADFNSSSGVISLDYTNGQKATSSVPGFLTSGDWTTFNNKGSGTVTSIGISSSDGSLTVSSTPVTSSGVIGLILNLAHANTWTADQTFGNIIATTIYGPLNLFPTTASYITDSSSNAKNGTVVRGTALGAGVTSVTGKLSLGASFTGGISANDAHGAISLPTNTVNNLSTWTFIAWVKPTDNTKGIIFGRQHDGSNTTGVVSIGSYPDGGGQLQMGTAGKIYFHAQNGVGNAQSTTNLSNGTWYLVSIVGTSSNCKIYINGTLETTTSGDFTIGNDTSLTSIVIGSLFQGGPSDFGTRGTYNGVLDELAWFSADVSSSFSTYYNSGNGALIPNNAANLKCLYHFEDAPTENNALTIPKLYDYLKGDVDFTYTSSTNPKIVQLGSAGSDSSVRLRLVEPVNGIHADIYTSNDDGFLVFESNQTLINPSGGFVGINVTSPRGIFDVNAGGSYDNIYLDTPSVVAMGDVSYNNSGATLTVDSTNQESDFTQMWINFSNAQSSLIRINSTDFITWDGTHPTMGNGLNTIIYANDVHLNAGLFDVNASSGAANNILTSNGSTQTTWQYIYDVIASAGVAFPRVALTNQGADITTTTLTGTAGLYHITYDLLDTTSAVGAGAVILTIAYTDDAGSTTTTATQLLTGVGRQTGSFTARLNSGNLTYATSHTGIFSTAKYALYIGVTKQ